MKQLIAISLALITLPGITSSGDHSPRLYFNRFHKELNNFQERSMDYYIANLTNADDKVIESNLKKTINQLELSRKHVLSAPVFKGDPSFRNNYLVGIDSLRHVFESDFSKVQKLKKYRSQSASDLIAYYEALEEAEEKVHSNENYLIDIEQKFANKYNIRLESDSKRDKQYEAFTRLNHHYRSLSYQFSKVDHSVATYLKVVHANTNVNLDLVGLNTKLEELNTQIAECLSVTASIEDSDLDPSLVNELNSFLNQLKKQSKKELKGITKTLETEPYYTITFRDAKTDLEFFSESYEIKRKKFLEARQVWIEKALAKLENAAEEF